MAARTLEAVPRKLAPRFWGMHLLALVLTGATVALGVWQYDAWQAHRDAAAERPGAPARHDDRREDAAG